MICFVYIHCFVYIYIYIYIYIFCIYKMYLISKEGYKNANTHCLEIIKTGKIQASMKNLQDGLSVANMSGLVLKQIYGRYGTKILTKKQIRKNKTTER